MRATDVIEAYIDDTVRLLPRRQRNDVAAELRSLLIEELHARATESGRSPDEVMALSLVRGYGRPNEAAARYQPAWPIIAAADTRSFVLAAIIGACVLVALSQMRPIAAANATDSVVLACLAWLGCLLVSYGIRNWLRHRWPATMLWNPIDRDRVNRLGVAFVVPAAACCVALYAAPARVLDLISGGRINTSWAVYTAEFQRMGLPLLIGLLAGHLALLAYVAIRGRRTRLTRRIDIGLNLALALLTLALAATGNIFESSSVDQVATGVLALVAIIYVPFVGVQLFGEIGRIDRVVAAPMSS